jgi:hypothetical protein
MLELEILQDQLGKKKGSLVTQETVDELNKLVDDPDYGEEFLDAYSQYFNVMEKNSQWSTPKYMNALKFFVLVEANHTAVDAYVKVFPERLAARHARNETKRDMGGEASRYNASALVNEIRKVANISVKLVHRHTFHDAIAVTAKMMYDNNVSPAVRQKAAEVLIRELKPEEDKQINVTVTNEGSAIDELRKATEALVMEQRRSMEAGIAVKWIAESNIIEAEVEA